MELNLYIDVVNRQLVSSEISDSPIDLLPLFREDTLSIRLKFLNPTNLLTEPFEVIDVTPLTITVGIGERDGTLDAVQTSWNKDTANNQFYGELDILTTSIESELLAASGDSIEKWFEIEIQENGKIHTALQTKCEIWKDVIRNGYLAPTEIEPPSELATSMSDILEPSETVTWTKVGDEIFGHIKGTEGLTTLEANKILKVLPDGSGFSLVDESSGGSGGSTTLDALTDTDLSTNLNDGAHLEYEQSSQTWIPSTNVPTHSHTFSLSDLSDTDLTSNPPTNGKLLGYDGSSWIPVDDQTGSGGGSGATQLAELSDCTLTNRAEGDHLVYDSNQQWVNVPTIQAHKLVTVDKAPVDVNSNAVGQYDFEEAELYTTELTGYESYGTFYVGDTDGSGITNMEAGLRVAVSIDNNTTSDMYLGFPTNWRWISDKPTTIAANKLGLLSLTCVGTTENKVIAAWAYES